MAEHDPAFADWLHLSWEELEDPPLPLEILLAQFPKRLQVGERHLQFDYQQVLESGEFEALLVIISDVSADLAAKHAENSRLELANICETVSRDRTAFVEFLADCGQRLANLVALPIEEAGQSLREIHTIKGNCSLYGVGSLEAACHRLESDCAERHSPPSLEQRTVLQEQWSEFREKISSLLGLENTGRKEVDESRLRVLDTLIRSNRPHEELAHALDELRYEKVASRLDRLAEQTKALAARMELPHLQVEVQAGDLRLPSERWAPLWSAIGHLLRNCLSHGIETPEEREAAGKSPLALVRLQARLENEQLVLTISDDGRGINWDQLRHKARARGVACRTQEELEQALFADGVSTSDELTSLSGRGVGLSAISQACEEVGVSIQVKSEAGEGTSFELRGAYREDWDAPSAAKV